MPSPHDFPLRPAFAQTLAWHEIIPSLPSIQRQIGVVLPTATDLAAFAVAHTDFIPDLDPATLTANAANSADLAADMWSDAHDGCTVPLTLIVETRRLLAEHGYCCLCAREQDEIDARLDGIESGDLDRDGNPIPYPTYRSV